MSVPAYQQFDPSERPVDGDMMRTSLLYRSIVGAERVEPAPDDGRPRLVRLRRTREVLINGDGGAYRFTLGPVTS